MTAQQIIIGVFVLINLFSFFIMGRDKRKAIKGKANKRAPEGFLFFLATMFGSVGVFLGMYAFRHKTKKWYFQIGIPMLVLQNVASIVVIFQLTA